MIKFLKILIITFLFTTSILVAGPKIDARTAILVDYHSEKVLFELEPDMSIYPASMTKIMTSIVAFDYLKNNKISLDDKIVVSEKAWRMSQAGYSSMFIMVNDEISVENLLRGIIIASGNDACVALAEGLAGTEENFAEIMTEKAKEIGMVNTNFANASGINDPDNKSTVRDIAIMSSYLIKNYPTYYEYFKEKNFTWDRTGGDPISQGNRNPLLYKNIGADGIKTGHLAVEQYSLASSVKKNTRRLISVGSGFKSPRARSLESIKLISWGKANTQTYEVSKKNESLFEIQTWLGKKNIVKGITKEDVYITIDRKNQRKFKVILDYTGPIVAPIKVNQEIAYLKIFNKNTLIKSVPVYASEIVKKKNFFSSIFTTFNYMIWGDA